MFAAGVHCRHLCPARFPFSALSISSIYLISIKLHYILFAAADASRHLSRAAPAVDDASADCLSLQRSCARNLIRLLAICLLLCGMAQAQAQERYPGAPTSGTVTTLTPPAVVISLLEIRRRNVVIQKWDLSCGAAALTTLLRYQHGEPVTEKLVAASLMRRPEYIEHPELIQVREGFSLLDLKRDVTARGYKGVGYGKMELKDALAKAPLLVPIQVNGYNHFVVFRGASNGSVLLADPAWGNRTMPIDAFVANWINYPGFGRVGFAVQRADGTAPLLPTLMPRPEDFPFMRRSDNDF